MRSEFPDYSSWQYFNPVQVFSGVGCLKLLPSKIPDGRLLVVTSVGFMSRELPLELADLLYNGKVTIYSRVKSNPELRDVDQAIQELEGGEYAGILAVGGGSVLDFAKILSVTLLMKRKFGFCTCVRNNVPIAWQGKIPLIAVPTTSGTGAEVTPFATVWDTATSRKYSITDPLIYPDLAFLDPLLTLSLPAEVTLNTALDSISHALEAIWNKNGNPISQSLAISSLIRSTTYLPPLLSDLANQTLRSEIQTASWLAGLAISHTRTAVAHSISYPLTLKLGIAHGLACSFTLSELITIYLEALPVSKALKELLKAVRALLLSLKLPDKIVEKHGHDRIIALSGTMYDPERADNFILPVDPAFISRVITGALALSPDHY